MYILPLLEEAARDLAKTPEVFADPAKVEAKLARYGIFMDCITEDEVKELVRMMNEFLN